MYIDLSRFPPNLDVSVCWIYQGNYMLLSIRRKGAKKIANAVLHQEANGLDWSRLLVSMYEKRRLLFSLINN